MPKAKTSSEEAGIWIQAFLFCCLDSKPPHRHSLLFYCWIPEFWIFVSFSFFFFFLSWGSPDAQDGQWQRQTHLRYQIHGSLSLQVLHSVEPSVLIAVAPSLCVTTKESERKAVGEMRQWVSAGWRFERGARGWGPFWYGREGSGTLFSPPHCYPPLLGICLTLEFHRSSGLLRCGFLLHLGV